MNNSPPIQILKFFGLHSYWINIETANFNSRFRFHLYPCFLCFIYLMNVFYSIIELGDYLNGKLQTSQEYVFLEFHFIYSSLVNFYPLISSINCILCYQQNEKILLKLHEFNITIKNRERQKLRNIIIQWFNLIMVLLIRFVAMFYGGYNWQQLLRYFICFSLILLDQLKFIIFVKEMIERFIIVNKMFLSGEKYYFLCKSNFFHCEIIINVKQIFFFTFYL